LNLENGGLDTWNQNSNIDLSTFEVSKITADLGIHAKSFTIHHYLAGWWFGTFFAYIGNVIIQLTFIFF
jgi:hypothetical protein